MRSANTLRTQALWCSIALFVCVLITHPFVEMGVNDDWSYIRSAFHLAQTGHIAYYGWTSPILGWQLYFGALFLKLFGVSFSVARFSVLIVAAATVYLVHNILIRCGIGSFNATIGTLTFALSPLFLPISFSFMSDIPGLFALVLCLYLCLRSLQAGTDRSAFRWLLAALLTNVLLGTARQTAWLGTTIMVPSTFYLLRKRHPPIAKAAIFQIVSLLCIFACLRWFEAQPFTMQERPLEALRNHFDRRVIVENMLGFVLSIPLLLLPVLIAFLTPRWTKTKKGRTAASLALAALGVVVLAGAYSFFHHTLSHWLAPFSENYVTLKGAVDIADIGSRPVILPPAVRAVITLLTFASTFACFACLFLPPAEVVPSTSLPPETPSNRQLLILLGPFTLVYFCLLLPRGLVGSMFDRYLLPLLLVALIACLRLYQQKVSTRLPNYSIACLVLVAAYSVATMHDLFAMERARLTAANHLLSAGVPRTAFYGGFEYDGWTQIDDSGYVLSAEINLPPGLRVPPSWITGAKPCNYQFARMFVAIHPSFALSYDPSACQGPSHFPPVAYRTWLPPRTDFIYTQTVSGQAAMR